MSRDCSTALRLPPDRLSRLARMRGLKCGSESGRKGVGDVWANGFHSPGAGESTGMCSNVLRRHHQSHKLRDTSGHAVGN